MKCKYVVCWISSLTGNPCSCGYPNKVLANKDAKALEKEGAKNVKVFPHEPKPVPYYV